MPPAARIEPVAGAYSSSDGQVVLKVLRRNAQLVDERLGDCAPALAVARGPAVWAR